MKITFIIIFLVIIAFIILFFILGKISKSGKAPGLVEGRLSKCPNTPNCVCSDHKSGVNHYMNPIMIPQNPTIDILSLLIATIQEMNGTIQAESDNYLTATFTSAVFGFVDDLEIRIDSAQHVIHLRSASRVGYSDTGVNKKRIKMLRELFYKKLHPK